MSAEDMGRSGSDPSAFALPPEREYRAHEDRLRSLPKNFQKGFEALEDHPQAVPHVVTVTDDDEPGGGNFAFISLGRIDVGRFDYNHDRAEVFVRVNASFPRGQKYGFATDKVLKIDGSTPSSSKTDRDHAEPLCAALDVDEVLYWSRNWDYMNVDPQDPAEMTKAIAWAKTVLREPFQN